MQPEIQNQAVLAWLQSEDRMPLSGVNTGLAIHDYAKIPISAGADVIVSLDLAWPDTPLRLVGIWDRRTQTFITRSGSRAGSEVAPGIQIARWGDVSCEIMYAANKVVAERMHIYRDAGPDSSNCAGAAKRAFLDRKPEPDLPYIRDARELYISFEDMALSRSDMQAVAGKHAQEFIRIDELNRNRCREIRAVQVRAAQIVAETEADPAHPWHQMRALLEALKQRGKTILVKWHGRSAEKRARSVQPSIRAWWRKASRLSTHLDSGVRQMLYSWTTGRPVD